mgnify:CR=1 FL=1
MGNRRDLDRLTWDTAIMLYRAVQWIPELAALLGPDANPIGLRHCRGVALANSLAPQACCRSPLMDMSNRM